MSKHDGDRKYWLAEATRLLSLYVRQIYADDNGNCQCFTCETILPWRQMDDGHCEERGNMSTFFELKNNHPQCPKCNRELGGRKDLYRKKIDERYGEGTAEMLRVESLKDVKFSWSELKEIAEMFKTSLQKNKMVIR